MLCEGDGWITCHCEEDAEEYFIEAVNGDKDSMRKMEEAKQEVSSAGMLLVSDPGWKRLLKEKLIEACKDKNTLKGEKFEDIFKAVEKAGKATCFVQRRGSSYRNGGTGTCLLYTSPSPRDA